MIPEITILSRSQINRQRYVVLVIQPVSHHGHSQTITWTLDEDPDHHDSNCHHLPYLRFLPIQQLRSSCLSSTVLSPFNSIILASGTPSCTTTGTPMPAMWTNSSPSWCRGAIHIFLSVRTSSEMSSSFKVIHFLSSSQCLIIPCFLRPSARLLVRRPFIGAIISACPCSSMSNCYNSSPHCAYHSNHELCQEEGHDQVVHKPQTYVHTMVA